GTMGRAFLAREQGTTMSSLRVSNSISIVASFALLSATGCLTAPDEQTDVATAAVESNGDQGKNNVTEITIPSGLDEGGVHTESAAPSCIERLVVDSRILHLVNGCGNTQWVKVIINFGPDSDCVPIGDQRIVVFTWGWPGSFGGLESC